MYYSPYAVTAVFNSRLLPIRVIRRIRVIRVRIYSFGFIHGLFEFVFSLLPHYPAYQVICAHHIKFLEQEHELVFQHFGN